MLLALLPSALAGPLADCPRVWTNRDVLDAVESADLAMRKLRVDDYAVARDRVLERVGCATEPLSGPTIGAVHRVVATGAFLDQDQARIAPALAGLLASDPGYQLPLDLYPEGHPLRALLPHAGILLRDPEEHRLATPKMGWMEVDGAPKQAVPTARASIVQAIDPDGRVVESRYVWPGDPLGEWAWVAPVTTALPTTEVAPPRKSPRVPLAVATGVALVATGVCYGVALSAHEAFYADAERPDADLVALRERANAFTIAWIGGATATVGLGVGLAVTW